MIDFHSALVHINESQATVCASYLVNRLTPTYSPIAPLRPRKPAYAFLPFPMARFSLLGLLLGRGISLSQSTGWRLNIGQSGQQIYEHYEATQRQPL